MSWNSRLDKFMKAVAKLLVWSWPFRPRTARYEQLKLKIFNVITQQILSASTIHDRA